MDENERRASPRKSYENDTCPIEGSAKINPHFLGRIQTQAFPPPLTSTLPRRTVYADMAYKALTVQELLELMKKIQGEKTNTQFAAEIGISKQYLTDIYNGRKVPSDTVSGALGFTTRVITQYVPSATAAKEEMPSAAPKSKTTRSRKRDS